MATIYLVRHAESVANTKGIYQGITYDTSLSDRGRLQALSLSEKFKQITINSIIASPLKRTYETAFYVAGQKNLSVLTERSLIETNHGRWEGKTKEEIVCSWPKLYRKWQKFPSRVAFPLGERFVDTQKRVLNWWQAFCNSHPIDTLVVSHDNIIRIIVAHIFHMKLNNIWKFHLQPTAVTEIEIFSERAYVRSLNDAHHVGDLQVDLAVQAL